MQKKPQSLREKHNKFNHIEIDTLKNTHTSLKMREDICNKYNWQSFIIKNILRTSKINNKRQTTYYKMGKRQEHTFQRKDNTNDNLQ